MYQNDTVSGDLLLYNGTQMNNEKLYNSSGQTKDITLSYWINIFAVSELPIATYCNVVALRIMSRCRKLPISIRCLSINVLIGFLTIGLSTLIHSVALLVGGLNNRYYLLIVDFRLLFFCVFLSVLWCSMCAVTVERFIAIVFPYHYDKIVKKSTLYITISFIWTFNSTVPSALVIVNWLKDCGQYDFISSCDGFSLLRPLRIFVLFILSISFVITIVIYSKILLRIRHHNREIQALNVKDTAETHKQTASTSTPIPATKIILIIIFSFIVLQSPYLFINFTLEQRQAKFQEKWRSITQFMCYICHELNSFVTLYLYIWRFPECRMNFYKMFSKINNTYRQKTEVLRMEVFNIVTFERNNKDITSAS